MDFPDEKTQVMNELFTKHFKKSHTKEALILLHGFPCINPITKNHDIAKAVNEKLNINSHLLHYRGLGNSKGNFSFKQSIEDSVEFTKIILDKNKYEKINLLGHSWGGLVALNIFQRFSKFINKIVLLSPFIFLPPATELKVIIKREIDAHPDILNAENFEIIFEELEYIRDNLNPEKFIEHENLNHEKVVIIQAKDDTEIPVSLTRDFVKQFRITPQYVEFDTDHDFIRQRDKIINMVIEYFKKS